MIKISTFILGLLLTTTGLTFIISYINLLEIGYNFTEYVKFIISRFECLLAPIGIIIIFFSFILKGDKNELHI